MLPIHKKLFCCAKLKALLEIYAGLADDPSGTTRQLEQLNAAADKAAALLEDATNDVARRLAMGQNNQDDS